MLNTLQIQLLLVEEGVHGLNHVDLTTNVLLEGLLGLLLEFTLQPDLLLRVVLHADHFRCCALHSGDIHNCLIIYRTGALCVSWT